MILVVDDDSVVRELLAEALDAHGYGVAQARDGWDAVHMLRTKPIDAVISDIQMPGSMTGTMLVAWITEQFPSMPLVLISGRANAKRMQAVLPNTPFFAKPFRLSAICETLDTLLKQQPRIEENGRWNNGSQSNVVGMARARLAVNSGKR